MVSSMCWRVGWVCWLVTVLLGCGSAERADPLWTPPATFRESQLVGTWTAHRMNYRETLVLHPDMTFTHIYTGTESPKQRPVTSQGPWRLEHRSSGCRYLHLEGMPTFHGTTEELATNGHRFPDGTPKHFWEPCEQTQITMPDKVILIVGNAPDAPDNLTLRFPHAAAVVTDDWLERQAPP